MYKPVRVNKPKVFEPLSPEYALASLTDSEFIEASSPYVLWWSVDRTATKSSQDELDDVYGEKGSGDRKVIFKNPNRVYIMYELNPILIEMTRLGIQQIEEITLLINMDKFLEDNFINPQSGDVFRISYRMSEQKYRNVFYEVSSVVPVDLFNFQYLNWHLFASQTTKDYLTDTMKNFMDLL